MAAGIKTNTLADQRYLFMLPLGCDDVASEQSRRLRVLPCATATSACSISFSLLKSYSWYFQPSPSASFYLLTVCLGC